MNNTTDTDDKDNGGNNNDKPIEVAAKQATIAISGDNTEVVYFNGKRLGSSSKWKQAKTYKVALKKGKNVLAVEVKNLRGKAGLISQITVGDKVINSNTAWKASIANSSGWKNINFNDSKWVAAKTYGKYGVAPWHKTVKGFPKKSSAQWIWSKNQSSDKRVYFRYTLNVSSIDTGDKNNGGNKTDKPIEVATKSNASVNIDVTKYDLNPKKISVTGKPSHGTLSVKSNKIVKYTPKKGYNGTDSFLITIVNKDGSKTVNSITVAVGNTESSKTKALTLKWNPSSGDVLGYLVYYGPTSGTVTKQLSDLHIGSKEVNNKAPSVTYDVKQSLGMASGESVCFRVKAYNQKGNSDFSKAACTTL
jgi:hypothetical protein